MGRKRDRDIEVNLLELKPRRNLEWESREGDLVTLVVPKFKNRWILRWFVPLLAKPNIRVKLDKFGSYLWRRCDGEATVKEIGEGMAAEFGEPLDSLYDRIGKFIQKLARDNFLILNM